MFGPMGALVEGRLRQVGVTGRPLEFEECLPLGESEVWLKTSLVPLADTSGFVLGVSRDITDSKRLEAALRERVDAEEHLATHDSLTGLENRRSFMVAFERALALAQRGSAHSGEADHSFHGKSISIPVKPITSERSDAVLLLTVTK
jgi:hypothetical protein